MPNYVDKTFHRADNASFQHRTAAQTKLPIGAADDPNERDADQAADRVVNLWQNGSLKAPEAASTTAPTQPLIQRRAVSPEAGAIQAPPEVTQQIQSARGAGQALPAALQPSLEAAFGMDFSGVRLHTDHRADTLNRDMQARAFTTGQDIFFRQGEYRPGTAEGVRLLGHELGHVGQQQLAQTSAVQCQAAEPDRGSSSDSILEMLSSAIIRADESQSAEVVITITKNGERLTSGYQMSEEQISRRSGTISRQLSSVQEELRPVLDSIRLNHGNGVYQILYRRNTEGRLMLHSMTRIPSTPRTTPVSVAQQPQEHSASEVAAYIIEEMHRNIRSPQAIEINRHIHNPFTYAEGLSEFRRMVGYNAPWDHKNAIETRFGRISHDEVSNRLFPFDLWSNIHYGYVGNRIGFSESTLLSGAGIAQAWHDRQDPSSVLERYHRYPPDHQHPLSPAVIIRIRPGRLDHPEDQVAIRIGFHLYANHQEHVTADHLMRRIRARAGSLRARIRPVS